MASKREVEEIFWFIHELQRPFSELEARICSAFIKQYSSKNKIKRILDAACGWGRHHKVLRENGWEVYGLDINIHLLQKANSQIPGYYQLGDLRSLPYRNESFDIVLNLGKSFGYFDEAQNEMCLKEFYRVLKKGGILMMELPNLYGVKIHVRPIEAYKVREYLYIIESEWEGRYLQGERFIYKRNSHDNLEMIFRKRFRIRIYSKFELDKIATQIGFHPEAAFSGLTILPYKEDSRRMLLIYKKS